MDLFVYFGIGVYGLLFGVCIGMGIALGLEIATLRTGNGRFVNFTYARIKHVEEEKR